MSLSHFDILFTPQAFVQQNLALIRELGRLHSLLLQASIPIQEMIHPIQDASHSLVRRSLSRLMTSLTAAHSWPY